MIDIKAAAAADVTTKLDRANLKLDKLSTRLGMLFTRLGMQSTRLEDNAMKLTTRLVENTKQVHLAAALAVVQDDIKLQEKQQAHVQTQLLGIIMSTSLLS